VKEINDQEPHLQTLTDDQLKAKTSEFKHKLKKGATLDNLLVEAFAVVREVSSRVLRLRHFDAQLVSIAVLVMVASYCIVWLCSGNSYVYVCIYPAEGAVFPTHSPLYATPLYKWRSLYCIHIMERLYVVAAVLALLS